MGWFIVPLFLSPSNDDVYAANNLDFTSLGM